MKKQILSLVILIVVLSSCATSKKTAKSIVVPDSPDGIIFTKVLNYKQFACILFPYEGKGFSKQESGSFNDTGDMVPTAKFYGAHINIFGDLSTSNFVKVDGNKSDVNVILEGLKQSLFLKSLLRKDNVVEQYTNVEVGGIVCKRVLLSSHFTKGNYSTVYYTLGYIVPHNETAAYFQIEKTKTNPASFEEHLKLVDEALKYMIATVEFKD